MAVDNEDEEVPPLSLPLLPDVHSQPTISSQMTLTHSQLTVSSQLTPPTHISTADQYVRKWFNDHAYAIALTILFVLLLRSVAE